MFSRPLTIPIPFLCLLVLLEGCKSGPNTIDVAAMRCEDYPSQTQISECKEKKQLGKQYYLDKATKMLLQGNEYESLELMDKAIADNPLSDKAHFNKALILANLGYNNEAIEQFDMAIKLNPEMSLAYYYKAKNLVEIHKYQEAIAACQSAVKLEPDFALAQYLLGILLLDAQKKEEARTALIAAYNVWRGNLKDNPGFFIQQTDLEKKYYKTRNYLRAIGYLKQGTYKISVEPDIEMEKKKYEKSGEAIDLELPTEKLWGEE